jgi:hypothetical protein
MGSWVCFLIRHVGLLKLHQQVRKFFGVRSFVELFDIGQGLPISGQNVHAGKYMQNETTVNTEIDFLVVTVRFRPTRLRDFFPAAEKKQVKGVKPGSPPSPPLPPLFGSLQKSRRLRCNVVRSTERRKPDCIERSY